MKTRFLLLGSLIAGWSGVALVNGTWGCGSSSTRASTSTADTIAITGTVSGASGTSASLSALGLKRAIADAPVADDPCTLYNDEGTVLGTGTTNADGTYTIDVDEAVLNPDGAASVTENVILESDSGYSTFAEITLTTDTSTVTVDADPDTTLAAQALLKKLKELGCTGLGGCNFTGLILDFDPFCFFKMEQKKWELAVTGEAGLGGQMGAMKDMMLGALAAGDYGSYGEPEGMMQAFMDGTVDDTFQATAADHAATFTGTAAGDYTGTIDDALTGFDTMADTFAARFAGGVGAGVTALKTKGAVDAAADSLCGDMLADASALEETIKTMLAGSATEFSTTFGTDAGVDNFYDVMKKYKGAEGGYAFGDDWNPEAMMGIMGGYQGNFDDFDPDAMFDMFDSLPADTAGTFDFHSWGAAMAGDFKDSCAGAGDCSYDPDARAGYWSAQVASGTEFDPTASNFGDYDFGGAFNSGGSTDYTACMTDPNSSACQGIVAGGTFTQGCFSNADCPSGETCNTNTKVCEATQSGGSGGFAGNYTLTTGTGACPPAGSATSLSGTSPSYTGTLAGAPIAFTQTGPGSCSFTVSNSFTASTCTFTGSGGTGSVISGGSIVLPNGTCSGLQLTKQ